MHPTAEILRTITKGIVKNPDAVGIEQTDDDLGVLFTLTVDPSDMGIVIGKAGAMIERIRLILKAAGIRSQTSIRVKVNDPRENQG